MAQAEAALDTLNKKDLGETKSLKKPPPGVDDITAVVIILLEGNPKDKSWSAATKLMNNVDKFMERLRTFKAVIDDGKVGATRLPRARATCMLLSAIRRNTHVFARALRTSRPAIRWLNATGAKEDGGGVPLLP